MYIEYYILLRKSRNTKKVIFGKVTRIAVIDTLDCKLVLNNIQCKMFY